MKKLILSTLVLLTLPAAALAWGHDGHVIVGQIATARIHQHAKDAVAQILAPGESLATVSTWADEVREAKRHLGPLANDPRAAAFNKTFPSSGHWHFVDLPLGTTAYAYPGDFASDDDIVQAMHRCIDTLRGKAAPSNTLTRRDALALLVHFAGDIHQPLHVSSGYFTKDDKGNGKLITDPVQAKTAASDRGGNQLFYTQNEELHARWDVVLVKKLMNHRTDQQTADALEAAIKPADAASWNASGDPRTWPEQWAIDTLSSARTAYGGIASYGPIDIDVFKNEVTRCEITTTPTYDAGMLPVAQVQIEKAGYRLAALLDAIWP
ncbi:MAG: S1/P1 nuclease [Capsulimonadaceae bacterium]|nr:S1/P1 nuclease [Capsulimonadaceae bacterium]